MDAKFKELKTKAEQSFMAFLEDLKKMCIESLKLQVYEELEPEERLMADVFDTYELLLNKYGQSFYNDLRNEMYNYIMLMMAVI